MTTFALDATPVLGHRTGIGRCVQRLVDGIGGGLAPDEELVLYASTFRRNALTGVSHVPLRRAAERPRVRVRNYWVPYVLVRELWNRYGHPRLDRVTGPIDVFHGTNYILPPFRQAGGVITIYDLAHLVHPETAPRQVVERFRRTVVSASRRADVIVTISEHSRRDIVRLLEVDPAKIRIIPLAVDESFAPSTDPERDGALLAERYGVRRPFVLFVGTTHPRKNLPALLEAFAQAKRRCDLDHSLVLVGDPGFSHGEMLERIRRAGLEDSVIHPGYVAEEDLCVFYRSADAFAFPSLSEGFGLPVLEAMASGCPVLTSSTSSLPEVAGDAALLVDPRDRDELAAGLEQILTSEGRRAQLRERGLERVARFSWDRFIAAHLELYRELAARGTRSDDHHGEHGGHGVMITTGSTGGTE